jgi:WD40 repeat protein
MTRAIIIFIIYSLPLINFGQNKVSEGLIDMELEGITSVVSDIVLSPDGNKLFLCGNANRAYLYDVSQKNQPKLLWKSTKANGNMNGGVAKFSSDGKYIAIQGYLSTTAVVRNVMWSQYTKAWQQTDKMSILDVATGNELLTVKNAYSISISNDVAFVSDKTGFKWYKLPSGELVKEVAQEDNEYAAMSPSGKYIVMSWDADKDAMKTVASVKRRKSELKNAYRAKKLLVIYNANDLSSPIAFSDDEIDVVTNMQYSADEKDIYIQCQQGGQENSTSFSNYTFHKIKLMTGQIDKNFGIRGNFCKTGTNGKVTSLFVGGSIGFLKQVRVQDPNSTEDFSEFKARYKLFKTSTLFCPITLVPNTNTAYVYYEKHLYLWDYMVLKSYFKKSSELSNEELVDKMKDAIDESLDIGDLKKEITKRNLTGSYIMDITVVGPKCTVQTIFCESDELTDIKMQNELKDLLRKLKFNLELPNDKRVKFRHTIQL